MTTPHTLLNGMIVLSVISLIVLILNLLLWRQSRRMMAHLAAQPAASAGQADSERQRIAEIPTSLLVTTLSRLEGRIIQLEESLKARPSPRPAPLPQAPDPDADMRYERAQQLIQESLTAEQIAQGSGLTLYEAELLLKIHRGP